MNCIDNNKPVFILSLYTLFQGVINNNKSIINDSIRPVKYDGYFSFYKHDKEFDALRKKEVTLLTNGVLYFTSNSKFPRTKLTETSFKRCIKPEKAQYFVYNYPNIPVRTQATNHLYETKYAYYLINDDFDYYKERIVNQLGVANNKETVEKFIVKYAPFSLFDDDAVIINKQDKTYYYILDNLTWAIINHPILSKLNFINDITLDKIISKKMESIDFDALLSFDEMLKSPDEDVVATAMRLITNYDTATYPLALRTLFILNAKAIRQSKVWNSTPVKQLRKSLNLDNIITSRNDSKAFPYCLQGVKDKNTYTKDDTDLGYKLAMYKMNLWKEDLRKKQIEECKKYNITPIFDD